jgi:hypothetical protein
VRVAGGDVAGALSAIAVPGSSTDDNAIKYATESLRTLADHIFRENLSSIPAAQRHELLLLAWQSVGAAGLNYQRFRDANYLAVEFGFTDSVFNNLHINQSQRVAEVLNRRLLTELKRFSLPISTVQEFDGLNLSITILHKDFLRDVVPDLDRVQIYASKALVREFAESAITSQEFIDGCVVILNGNRIKVPLSGD